MDKHILLIGGHSGIGLELKKKLQKQEHQLTIACRNSTEPNKQIFDATEPSQLDLPEKLDGVVYCPGTIHLKPFHRLSHEDFLQDLQINTLGAIHVLQQAFNSLKRSPQASVVLFSTVAVDLGMPFHSSIAVAKGALEGLTKSLAAEWAPKIRVNAIAPSLTDTKLASAFLSDEKKRDAASDRHPLKSIGSPEDVADLACMLLSEQSRFMTGQIIRPDGGLSSIRLF